MLGLGGKNKKDKLEENMEEIKQMIDRGDSDKMSPESSNQQDTEAPAESFQNPGQDSTQSSSVPQDKNGTRSFGQGSNSDSPVEGGAFDQKFETDSSDVQNTFDTPEGDKDSFSGFQEDESSVKQSSSPQETSENTDGLNHGEVSERSQRSSSSNDASDRNQGSRSGHQNDVRNQSEPKKQSSDMRTEIPDPPETKQLNVPDVDKGPLFIKRKKFESAVSMIRDMKQISAEIDRTVNRLQKGIEEDRKTQRSAKELLHELEDDRKDVRQIVSPDDS